MSTTDAYGFIAARDEHGEVQISDCMGGGKELISSGGLALVDEIADFITSHAREYAAAMVEELGIDEDDESEEA